MRILQDIMISNSSREASVSTIKTRLPPESFTPFHKSTLKTHLLSQIRKVIICHHQISQKSPSYLWWVSKFKANCSLLSGPFLKSEIPRWVGPDKIQSALRDPGQGGLSFTISTCTLCPLSPWNELTLFQMVASNQSYQGKAYFHYFWNI